MRRQDSGAGCVPAFLITFGVGAFACIALLLIGIVTAKPSSPPAGPLRVHQSQIVYYRPGSDTVALRCPLCDGKGWTNQNPRGQPETCPTCQGTGIQTVRLEGKGLVVVPEDQPL